MGSVSQVQIADGRRTKKRGSSGLLLCVSPTSLPLPSPSPAPSSLRYNHLFIHYTAPLTYLLVPTIIRFLSSPLSTPPNPGGCAARLPHLRLSPGSPRCGAFTRGVVSRPSSSALCPFHRYQRPCGRILPRLAPERILPNRCRPMVVWAQPSQDGRLRASIRPAQWQFSDRLPWDIGHHGKIPRCPPPGRKGDR